MGRDYTKIMTEILISLKNLNDKARICEDTLIEVCAKMNKLEQANEKQDPSKHIVVLRVEDKKRKGEI